MELSLGWVALVAVLSFLAGFGVCWRHKKKIMDD